MCILLSCKALVLYIRSTYWTAVIHVDWCRSQTVQETFFQSSLLEKKWTILRVCFVLMSPSYFERGRKTERWVFCECEKSLTWGKFKKSKKHDSVVGCIRLFKSLHLSLFVSVFVSFPVSVCFCPVCLPLWSFIKYNNCVTLSFIGDCWCWSEQWVQQNNDDD